MSRSTQDTIVAVSSPPGRSARGLVRVSGVEALRIAREMLDDVPAGRLLMTAQLRLDAKTPTLPVLVFVARSPGSYTGDDLVEVQLPGNPALLDRVLHAVIARGARLAEPGEFTFRAYLAGKLDLTQAEGIAATIAATSDSQLHAATLLREGKLGALAARLVDELGTTLALVEAGIDFVDQDDVVPISPGALDERLAGIEGQLDDLLSHSRSWGAVEALPRVVLVGAPSAGKSTLFNALLGRQRAVISAEPGTTRDVLAEPMALRTEAGGSVEVMLVDIAGLDEPRGLIDEQMQAAARRAIDAADLLLLVDDGSGMSNGLLFDRRCPVIDVRAKADLLGERTAERESRSNVMHVAVSAHTGHNLDFLRSLIVKRLGSRAVSVAADMLALQPRHESALRAAHSEIAAARELLSPQQEAHAIDHVELVAGAMRGALDQLAALGGTLTPDDVIGRVFAAFCIGK